MDRVALDELLKISHAVGSNPDITQGGGGNTSVKTADGTMLIKASGTALADMSEDAGWVELDLQGVLDLLEDPRLQKAESAKREAMLKRRLGGMILEGPGERPSVECVVHALLGRVVIHTHPVAPGSLACAEGGKDAAHALDLSAAARPALAARQSARTQDEGAAATAMAGTELAWLDYLDPGYPLAQAIKALPQPLPPFIVQANHGLFVHAEDADAGLNAHAGFLAATGHDTPLEIPGQPQPAADALRTAVLAVRRTHGQLAHPDEERIECHTAPLVRLSSAPELLLAGHDETLRGDLAHGALSPDHVVYNGPRACRAASADAVAEAVMAYQEAENAFPRVIVVEGVGTLITGTSPKMLEAAEATAAAGARILLRTRQRGLKPQWMSDQAVSYIRNWEVESYRARMLAGARRPLEGRIALVTGGGSGLGRSIATGLAKAGAVVCFTDIDLPAAQAAAEGVGGAAAGASALKMNVTEEDSVRQAFDGLLARYGGADIVVNAAGVAPPYNLVEFPLDKWEFALKINLTGYFLVGREAARVMRRQKLGGSIVNLSSKSGLEASRANSAYNATKAGEIHLARGWALELAQDLIRVNCIAPGNVFEGSKIWNPDYIRKAAQKRGIKPEEVIPYYVSLSPLKMEIKGQDIADAAVFLASDTSRRMTGQVLVVDCGQVMVR